MSPLPQHSVLALGGPIASSRAGQAASPRLTPPSWWKAYLAKVARVDADTFRQSPRPS
jgi:hypothetical protein